MWTSRADFQKLVQARAGVRVWVRAAYDAREHIRWCREAIQLFDRSQLGDRYIFAIRDGRTKTVVVEPYTFAEGA